jgi:ribonuclease PH
MRHKPTPVDSLRKISIKKDFIKYAEGSCLISVGNTKVICTASVEEGVPVFLRNTGKGWITAEYSMLPRSSKTRSQRESSRGRVGGRTHEIQRLIGRSLRSVVNMDVLGERTIWIDCDVIQADGGTRTASITGAFVALADCLLRMKKKALIDKVPVSEYVAAVSVGIVDGKNMLDLDYEQDSRAEVDMNIVMTSSGNFVEIQGTAERCPFSENQAKELLELGKQGIKRIINLQKQAVSIR